MHRDKIRLYTFYIGIILIIIGLPFSRALISFGQVVFAVLFLFDPNLLSKLKLFVKDKAAISFVSIYILWWVGLIYSSDLNYALFDLRTKLPLLLFPLVFATEKPLSKTAFTNFSLLFSATVIVSIITSMYIYYSNNMSDYRDAFVFVSHIRISLMALVVMVILLYTAIENKHKSFYRGLMIAGAIFLIISQFLLSMLSGVFIFLILFIVFSFRLLYLKANIYKLILSLSALSISLVFIIYSLSSTINNYNDVSRIDLNNLDSLSSRGHKYVHVPFDYQVENGNYIGIYIQWGEMYRQWEKISSIDFDSLDNKGQKIQITLLRYLNSKGLRKDADGVLSLTDQDIKNVENGIANVEYAKKISYKKRIYRLIWQYNVYENDKFTKISGHTILQRLELWKVGVELIKQNPIFGIGTGDINKAYSDALIKKTSQLANNGLRSHNQYISVMVTLGVFGLIIFVFSIIYPAYISGVYKNPLFLFFIIILVISMFWEDTIESQVGVTLYSFFYMFFLYHDKKEKGLTTYINPL